jgi:hypothetical protein
LIRSPLNRGRPLANIKESGMYKVKLSDIIEKFGSFTKPSIGTIHPALKRLLKSILRMQICFTL